MVVWKNIKCPRCGKPNERISLKKRNGACMYCGFKLASNIKLFLS